MVHWWSNWDTAAVQFFGFFCDKTHNGIFSTKLTFYRAGNAACLVYLPETHPSGCLAGFWKVFTYSNVNTTNSKYVFFHPLYLLCAILEYMVILQFCLSLIWHGLYQLAPTASHLKYYTALYAFSYWKKLKFLCGFSNLAHMRHAWRKIYFPLLSVSIQNQFSYPT